MTPPRPPTDPGLPLSVKDLAYLVKDLQAQAHTQNKVFRTLAPKVEEIEKQLVEVRGLDGKGGQLAWLSQEQQRSSQAQGFRIGNCETEIGKLEGEVRKVRESQIDMKARWAAAIAAILALVDLVLRFKGG